VLARQAAAAVVVGTCWPWETAATLPSARRRKALRHPRDKRGGAYRGGARLQLVYVIFQCMEMNNDNGYHTIRMFIC